MSRIVLCLLLVAGSASAAEIRSIGVVSDLAKSFRDPAIWAGVKEETVSLMAQPMALPRPKVTTTALVRVQSLNDGKWIAFRMTWSDEEKSEAGRLGKFSDAVAIQFPVNEGTPPPIFMGAKDQPVHILHWRAQYQRDNEVGKPEMRDLYPNMNPDMYPMEFKDPGHITGLTDAKREVYAHGKAAGNPQSYQKHAAVDEIVAEGFGSSSVIDDNGSLGHGDWSGGAWSVVIARPMKPEHGSKISVGKSSFLAFAVWQGGKDEVGGRKSVTMSWVPLVVEAQGSKP